MRLSEAIRLGGMSRPQCTGVMARLSLDGQIESICALGAAGFAAGLDLKAVEDSDWELLYDQFPLLRMEHPDTPDRIDFACNLGHLIYQMNDSLLWSRERIADWVEGIERERGLWPAMEIALEPSDVVRLAEKLGVEI